MSVKYQNQLYRWFQLLNIPVSKTYLEKELLIHPDYPSLASITDVMDDLKIPNIAMVVEKDKLREIPVPFMIHISGSGGEFMLVENASTLNNLTKELISTWDGIIILAEKPDIIINEENAKALYDDKLQFWLKAIILGALFLLSLTASFITFSPIQILLLLTTIGGTFVSASIIQKQFGYSNYIADQICGIGKETGCETVIQSNGSKLIFGLTWGDAGIIYFITSWFLLVITSIAKVYILNIFSIITVAVIPFTFLSIYYQLKVIKKKCMLCMLIIMILWVQCLLILPGLLKKNLLPISFSNVLLIAFSLLLFSSLWILLIKKNLLKNKLLRHENYQLIRFKRSSETFAALLRKQKNADMSPFDFDIRFGNKNSDIQFLIVCSPYCKPCAKTHLELDKLLEKNPNEFGITIRFATNSRRKDKVVDHILNYWIQKGDNMDIEAKNILAKSIIHDWFATTDFEKFSNKYKVLNFQNPDEILKKTEDWCNKTKIEYTPTIFLNGYEVPKQYKVSDFKLIFRGIKEEV